MKPMRIRELGSAAAARAEAAVMPAEAVMPAAASDEAPRNERRERSGAVMGLLQ